MSSFDSFFSKPCTYIHDFLFTDVRAKTIFCNFLPWHIILRRDRRERERHVSLLSSDSNPRQSVELHQTGTWMLYRATAKQLLMVG